jgi:anti-anti-sigma regulatory factor
VSAVSGRSRRPSADSRSAHRDGRVLRLSGEIDIANAEAVRDRGVAEICAGVDRLDLSGVTFYGVAGLAALLDGHSLLRSQKLLHRCQPLDG